MTRALKKEGSVAAVHYDNWKATVLRQDAEGIDVRQSLFEERRC